MTGNPLDAYIRATAALLAITIDPAWSPNVAAHLAAIRTAADLVETFDLEDEIEAAPMFTP